MHHSLLEALPEGCPICLVVDRNTERLIDALLYERVNDPLTRRRLRQSLGFCNRHAWQVRASGDVLGQTIVYEDLMTTIADRLKARECPKPSRICPVCEEEQKVERLCIVTLLQHFRDSEFQRLYQDSSGVCLPHLALALAESKDAELCTELVRVEQSRIAELIQDLAELKRRHDYRFAREPSGRESGAWIRAIEKLCGRPGTRPLTDGPRTHNRKAK
jgi:hypothetical protein